MVAHADLTTIHPAAYFTSSDPGAVGAGKQWVDKTSGPPYQLKVRNAGNSAWETVGVVSGFANPMTTSGDVIYGGASGTPTRLAVGSSGKVLTVVGGLPAWATPRAASPLTTQGDIIYGGASGVETRLAAGSVGQHLALRGGTIAPAWEWEYTSINFMIDGAAAVITTGVKGNLVVDFDCTIVGVTMLADVSGSIVVDIWKCTYSQYDAGSTHPVSGDKITASAPPTISSATKSQDTTLTGWTTTISAGDVLRFNVNSAVTITNVTLALKLKRT